MLAGRLRRFRARSRAACTFGVMARRLLLAMMFVLPLVAACGDDGAGSSTSCVDLDGRVLTADEWTSTPCTFEGRPQIGHSTKCEDGRELFANEALWGFGGEAAHVFAGLPESFDDPEYDAALDACLGID